MNGNMHQNSKNSRKILLMAHVLNAQNNEKDCHLQNNNNNVYFNMYCHVF